jgi:hypothetical protein
MTALQTEIDTPENPMGSAQHTSHYVLLVFVVVTLGLVVYFPMIVLIFRMVSSLGPDDNPAVLVHLSQLLVNNGDIDSIATVLQMLIAAIAAYQWRNFSAMAFYSLCAIMLVFVLVSYMFSSLALDSISFSRVVLNEEAASRAAGLYKSSLFLLTTLLGVRAAQGSATSPNPESK